MAVLEKIELETKFGKIECRYFRASTGENCLILSRKPWGEVPFVRMHSACMFSESLHSNTCDCALQLDAALEVIGKEGGIVIYLFQEGRGLGLLGKMHAIRTEVEKSLNTAAAFAELGYESDVRDYRCAAEALREIGVVDCLRLATNNPKKVKGITDLGFVVTERYSLEIQTTPVVDEYLEAKREHLGHFQQ